METGATECRRIVLEDQCNGGQPDSRRGEKGMVSPLSFSVNWKAEVGGHRKEVQRPSFDVVWLRTYVGVVEGEGKGLDGL